MVYGMNNEVRVVAREVCRLVALVPRGSRRKKLKTLLADWSSYSLGRTAG